AAPGMACAAGPQEQLTWGVHISLAPTWFDPAETPGIITPFMVLYALHDAVVKPMPGNPLLPCTETGSLVTVSSCGESGTNLSLAGIRLCGSANSLVTGNNIGNFIETGLGCAPIGGKMDNEPGGYDGIPYALEQGINWRLAGN